MPVVLHREGPVFRCETSAHLDQHKHGDTCQKPAQGNSPRLSPLIAKLKMRQSVRHLASANKKFFPAPGYAGVLCRLLCVCSCGNCCLSMSDTPHAHHFCFIEWLRICTYQKGTCSHPACHDLHYIEVMVRASSNFLRPCASTLCLSISSAAASLFPPSSC